MAFASTLIPVNAAVEDGYPVQRNVWKIGSDWYGLFVDDTDTGNIYMCKSTDGGATWSTPLDFANQQANGPMVEPPGTISGALMGTDIYVLLSARYFVVFHTATDTWDANFFNYYPGPEPVDYTNSPWHWLATMDSGTSLVAFFVADLGSGTQGLFYSLSSGTGVGITWGARVQVSPTYGTYPGIRYRVSQILVEPGTGRIGFVYNGDDFDAFAQYAGTTSILYRSLNGGVLGTAQTIATDLNNSRNFNFFGSDEDVPRCGLGCAYIESAVPKLAIPYYGGSTIAANNKILLANAADNPTWSTETVDTTLPAVGFENFGCEMAAVFCGGTLQLLWVTPLMYFDTIGPPFTNDIVFDWDALGPLDPGDTITASIWTYPPPLTTDLELIDGLKTRARFVGGVFGTSYSVDNHIDYYDLSAATTGHADITGYTFVFADGSRRLIASGMVVLSTRSAGPSWSSPEIIFTPGENIDPTGIVPVCDGTALGVVVSAIKTDTFFGTTPEKIASLLQYFLIGTSSAGASKWLFPEYISR